MDGRNEGDISSVLRVVAQVVQNNHNGGNDEFRNLGKLKRNNPSTFKGRYHLYGAQAWLKDIEKIFRGMVCTEEENVQFGTPMLAKETDDWWDNTRQKLKDACE